MNFRRTVGILALLLGITYLLTGVIGAAARGHWDEASASDEILWYVFSFAGALLLAVGLRALDKSPWIGAVVASVGAVVGALPIFWTFVVPLVAILFVVLIVVYARRISRPPRPTPA